MELEAGKHLFDVHKMTTECGLAELKKSSENRNFLVTIPLCGFVIGKELTLTCSTSNHPFCSAKNLLFDGYF